MSRYVNIDEMGLRKTISLGGLSAKALWRMIRQQPSIDIVRCRECKWAEIDRRGDKIFCTAIIPNFYIGENDFCSRGERKESDDGQRNEY